MLRPYCSPHPSPYENWFDWLVVAVDFAGVIAENDFLLCQLDDVFRQQRNLAASARRVDYEMRDGESRRPAAQRLDDLQPLLHRGPEVLGPRNLVAPIDVVGTNPRKVPPPQRHQSHVMVCR